MTRAHWNGSETEVLGRIRDELESDAEEPAEAPPVLATLVDVEGSAYRRPGAKMVLESDGGVGAITAGCLEDELRRAASDVRETGDARLVAYDLRDDEGENASGTETERASDVWGLGVGCNGRLEILLEPITPALGPAVAAFEAGRDLAAITVLADDGPLERGDRAYYDDDPDASAGERTDADSDDGRLETIDGASDDWPASALEGPATELLESGRGTRLALEVDPVLDRESAGTSDRESDGEFEPGTRRLEVFVDGLVAPPELLVCGSGPDVAPVVELAARNGFRVTVVGFRGAVDLEERFPGADRTVTTSPARLREALEPDARTYAVVMTHNFVDDRLAIDELLRTEVPYVGLMGPRERFEEMLEAFATEGREFSEGDLERLYTPVGLDLGSGSPYGIAHGIVAEVLAVSNDREPGHLSAREGPIHERVEVGLESDTESGHGTEPEDRSDER